MFRMISNSLSNKQKLVLLTYMVWLISLLAGVHGHFAVVETSNVGHLSVSMDLVEGDDLADHELNSHVDLYSDVVQPKKNNFVQLDLPSVVTAFTFVFLILRIVRVFCFFYISSPLCRIIGWRPQMRAPPVFIV